MAPATFIVCLAPAGSLPHWPSTAGLWLAFLRLAGWPGNTISAAAAQLCNGMWQWPISAGSWLAYYGALLAESLSMA